MNETNSEHEAAGSGRPDAGSGSGDVPSSPGPSEMEQLKRILLFLPRFAVMLGKLIADPGVSPTDKLLLGAVVAYLASPLDILPDILPVVGHLDDIYLVALVLLRLLNRSGPAKLRQHWDGPEDIVAIVNTVTDVATRYLPEPVRRAVRGWIESRDRGAPPEAPPGAPGTPSEGPR
jgi:uncharacterized membrane protein YkvA (DUF1232 family)